jgi:hypothetical protein
LPKAFADANESAPHPRTNPVDGEQTACGAAFDGTLDKPSQPTKSVSAPLAGMGRPHSGSPRNPGASSNMADSHPLPRKQTLGRMMRMGLHGFSPGRSSSASWSDNTDTRWSSATGREPKSTSRRTERRIAPIVLKKSGRPETQTALAFDGE